MMSGRGRDAALGSQPVGGGPRRKKGRRKVKREERSAVVLPQRRRARTSSNSSEEDVGAGLGSGAVSEWWHSDHSGTEESQDDTEGEARQPGELGEDMRGHERYPGGESDASTAQEPTDNDDDDDNANDGDDDGADGDADEDDDDDGGRGNGNDNDSLDWTVLYRVKSQDQLHRLSCTASPPAVGTQAGRFKATYSELMPADEHRKWLEATIRCCAEHRPRALRGFVDALEQLRLDKQWTRTKDAIVDKVLPVVEYRFEVAGTRSAPHADIAASFTRAKTFIPAYTFCPSKLRLLLSETTEVCSLYSVITIVYDHLLTRGSAFNSNLNEMRDIMASISMAVKRVRKLAKPPLGAVPTQSDVPEEVSSAMQPLVRKAVAEASTLRRLIQCQCALLRLNYKDAMVALSSCRLHFDAFSSGFRKSVPLARRLQRIINHTVARTQLIFFENFARPAPPPPAEAPSQLDSNCYVKQLLHLQRKYELEMVGAFAVAGWASVSKVRNLHYRHPLAHKKPSETGLKQQMPTLFGYPYPVKAGFLMELVSFFSGHEPPEQGQAWVYQSTSSFVYVICRADECIAVVCGFPTRKSQAQAVDELQPALSALCTRFSAAFSGHLA